jgi:hypothetical protein
MLSPPGAHTEFISLSLGWGSWVALGAAVAIVGGGIWTPSGGESDVAPAQHLPL